MRADAPEVLASPAPRRLHLIGDVQRAPLPQDRGVLAEQPVRRHGEPADALHRLGDQAGHVAGGGGGQHVPQVLDARGAVLGIVHAGEGGQLAVGAVQVVHGERGQRRALPRAVAGDRDGPEGPAVVAVAQREHLVGPAGGGGQHQRGLVGLGAGVGEEHLGVLDPRQPGQLLGQLHLVADQVQGGGVHDAGVELALHRLAHLGHVIAQHVGQDPAEEVQVGAAGGVGDAAAAAAGELQRLGVVETEPVRDDAAVPLVKFRHGPSLADERPQRRRHSVIKSPLILTVCSAPSRNLIRQPRRG